MINNWKFLTIGEVTKIVNGGTPKSKVIEYWDGEIAWITPKDMGKAKNIYVDVTGRTISELGLQKSSAKLLPENSVILSTRAPIGHLIINTIPMATNQGCRGLIPKNNLDTKFLFYFLKLNIKLLNDLGSGTTFKELSTRNLSEVKIPLPPLEEQKQIVAILDEAFEGIDKAIENTEKNLANAREIFESYLNSIFINKGDDWVEKKLNEICSIKHGFAFKSEFFTNEENDYIVLTPGSFYESGGYRDQESKTKYYIGEIPDGFILSKNDMLVAMTEQAVGLLGSTIIVPESHRFLHNQRLGLFQVHENIEWNNDFFFHQFNTHRFRKAVQETASGVKVRHTSPKKLGVIPVYFPPNFSKQQIIADQLNDLQEETQRLETIYKRKIEALKELKQSILQKAFTGELTNPTVKKEAA